MKYRKLQIAWSVAWGALAVLLIALCIHSAWYVDIFGVPIIPGKAFVAESYRGSAHLFSAPKVSWQYIQNRSDATFYNAMEWSYCPYGEPLAEGIVFAYWLIAIATATLPFLPWLRRRFSLRTLLIATTLVAVGLGLIVWLRMIE